MSANTTESAIITEGFEDICECRIGYQRYGNGPNYCLFICGGVGSYKKDFPEHVLRAFDPTFYTIVCLDPPGYGTSRPPKRAQGVHCCKNDAKYCVGLMKALNLEPYTVLGWSEGARTSVHVASLGKTNVSRVVMIAASTRVDNRLDQAFQGVRNVDQWMPETLEPYTNHYPISFVRTEWAAISDMVHDCYTKFGGRFPSDLILHTVKQPVLVVYGAKDRFIMDQQTLLKMLPNAREACHAQGGHDFYVKHPRWLSLTVTRFMQETGNPKSSL